MRDEGVVAIFAGRHDRAVADLGRAQQSVHVDGHEQGGVVLAGAMLVGLGEIVDGVVGRLDGFGQDTSQAIHASMAAARSDNAPAMELMLTEAASREP